MLSLVVPVYNEEDVIETAVGNILKEFEKSKIKMELILVNIQKKRIESMRQ